jgi:hypothetical protein
MVNNTAHPKGDIMGKVQDKEACFFNKHKWEKKRRENQTDLK